MPTMTTRRRIFNDRVVRAATLAAQWAQRLNLPAGNLWEPAITRHVLQEVARLGNDENGWAFVESLMKRQLGLD